MQIVNSRVWTEELHYIQEPNKPIPLVGMSVASPAKDADGQRFEFVGIASICALRIVQEKDRWWRRVRRVHYYARIMNVVIIHIPDQEAARIVRPR